MMKSAASLSLSPNCPSFSSQERHRILATTKPCSRRQETGPPEQGGIGAPTGTVSVPSGAALMVHEARVPPPSAPDARGGYTVPSSPTSSVTRQLPLLLRIQVQDWLISLPVSNCRKRNRKQSGPSVCVHSSPRTHLQTWGSTPEHENNSAPHRSDDDRHDDQRFPYDTRVLPVRP